jgi:prolyl 4-hydroxylase
MLFPGERLWLVDDVFDRDECGRWIDLIERSQPALATNNPLHRDQDRVIVDDGAAADELHARLAPGLPHRLGDLAIVGLNPRLRLYRYGPGQRFAEHTDHWYQPSPTEITLLTVLVYLNDGFVGGETRFTEHLDAVVDARPGRVAVFQHKLRHEGAPVVSGTKYAIRSDVIYRAQSEIELTYRWPG